MSQQPGSTSRVVAVDVLRGMTIAAMILVNNPGTWGAIYPPLRHAEWHGWTPTDLVFPFFLFLVGVAIPFALQRRIERGDSARALMGKIVKRSVILIALGLFMAAFPLVRWEPEFGMRSFERLRFPGVLQRIGVCYCVVAILFVRCRPKVLFGIGGALLLAYWGAMMWIPVPGPSGFGPLEAGAIDAPGTHVSAYLDRLLLGENHIWRSSKVYDPEGLLSTLPAIATCICGVAVGLVLQRPTTAASRVRLLLVLGLTWTVIGYAWGWVFPINKKIWTSSFVLFTAGLATTLLAGVAYWTDVRAMRRFVDPFVTYGLNALTVFVMSGLLAKTMALVQVADGVSLKRWLYSELYESVFGPGPLASLMFALSWVIAWYGVLRIMRTRGIVLRV